MSILVDDTPSTEAVANTAPLLQVEGVDLFYGLSQILYGVSMEARAGQVTCVMGPNGVGKTSLLKAIVGQQPVTSGRVLLAGRSITDEAPFLRARAGIAYVPQGREIFPLMSVEENLRTGFDCLPRADRRVPEFVFELFPILRDFLRRRGGDLSGGQQQQLAIARALITRPKVLILDEPTEGIQPNIIQDIGNVIRRLKAQGDIAILLVEQYFDFAADLADHFHVMRRGEVVLAGPASAVDAAQVKALITV